MFTNWLTGTTGSSSSASSITSSSAGTITNRLHETPVQTPNGLSLAASGLSATLNPNMLTTPPDVILEVGPGPTTMRFMAHSIMLGMHSGYLRSAVRLDERGAGAAHSQHGGDFVVYLSNVTPEQFAPLLSYMYTGYLDLNVENIFGVLLATHVLHMPRALEICRSYLARAQAEGYFGNSNTTLSNPLNNTATSLASQQAPKIIRPIASKPQLANFGFLPIGHTMPVTPSLNCRTSTITSGCSNNASAISATISTPMGKILEMETNKDDEGGDIEVDELDRQSMTSKGRNYAPPSAIVTNNVPPTHEDDDEDVEVFIDTTSEDADVVVECDIQQKISFKNQNHKIANTGKESAAAAVSSHHSSSHGHNRRHDKTHKKSSHSRSDKRRKSGNNNSLSSTGLQVAKAPIPASQLDTSEANKVIIDVASCDGPVRFKRILNTAYGHKPETCSAAAAGAANHHHMNVTPGQERSLQSVSLSFHQQMAKTISQQQHLNNAEESENSETSNGSIGTGNNGGVGGGGVAGAPKLGRKIQNEIFVCVYCKHTFKSQYCYQKHAKRHLNPLTLQATCVPPPEKRTLNDESSSTMTTTAAASSSSSLMATTEQQSSSNLQKIRPFVLRNSGMSGQQSGGAGGGSSSADFLRREVRPLDMNVQYYPCKTCGCKFPSYYFVHKHRKMCHAEEEAAAAAVAVQQNVNGNNGGAGTGTSSLEESAQTANEDDNHHMDEETKEKN